jgi:cellobiose phosphorylase
MKLIQLLDPPFEGKGLDPGYIKGYVPGVRENGGQYSHAAIWALMAFAELGQRQITWELFNMIQPLNHAAGAREIATYKVEPYVMAADVYANESHIGRGGWTWYTGSAGWMYQFIVGSLLGMELRVDRLRFRPCFPLDWPSISVNLRFGSSRYRIKVFQEEDAGGARSPSGLHAPWWKMDDRQGQEETVQLIDDGKQHQVELHYPF